MIQSGPTVAPKPEAQRNRPGFRGHDLEFNNFLLPSQRFEMRNLNGLPLGSARLLGGESLNVNRKVRKNIVFGFQFTSIAFQNEIFLTATLNLDNLLSLFDLNAEVFHIFL
jgi:hypothetical protein